MTGLWVFIAGPVALILIFTLFTFALCRAAAWGDRPVDPPLPVVLEPQVSPDVERLTVAYDLLAQRETRLLATVDECRERGDRGMAFVWQDEAVRVNQAMAEVAKLRAIKAGEL